MQQLPEKELRLGERTVRLTAPIADDEYWRGLVDGVDDGFFQICRRLVRPGDTCCDIGANLGVTSLLLAQLPGPPALHAFEPGPRNYAALCRNLAANGAAHVRAVQAAVSDQPGRARFLEASAYGHISATGTVDVEVITLPGYLDEQGIDRLDFCKLDIEGHEQRVLRHALPIFERDHTVVYFEFNSWCQLAYGSTNPKDFIDWICATFPAVYAVRGTQLQPVIRPLDFLQTNLVHHGCVDDLVVSTDLERLDAAQLG